METAAAIAAHATSAAVGRSANAQVQTQLLHLHGECSSEKGHTVTVSSMPLTLLTAQQSRSAHSHPGPQ